MIRGLVTKGGLNWNVDLLTGGTFARTATAIAQTGAPTDGSSSFITTFATGVRATENMGDGAGALLRIEGARTNFFNSRDWQMAASGWQVGLATMSGGEAAPAGLQGLDTTNVASRAICASGQYGNFRNAGPYPAGTYQDTVAMWMRATATTKRCISLTYLVLADGLVVPGAPPESDVVLTTTYQRVSVTRIIPGGDTAYWYPGYAGSVPDHYSGTPFATDVIMDYMQGEEGANGVPLAFPSSLIYVANANTPVTRDADILSFTSGQLPAALFSNSGQFTQVSPEFANTDLVSGDVFWLWAIDANNGIRIKHNGANVVVEAVQGGAVKASSGALTFARNALLGAVRWDPVAAVIYVNGVGGAAGTPWTWSPGNIRVGGIPSSTGEAFCRFGLLKNG